MIRLATQRDAQALLDIYSHYILNTAVTYEYEVPTLEAFQSRMTDTLRQFPYLVWEEDGVILGYAYASRFRERKAYDWSVEASVYIHKDARCKGIGRALYHKLEECLRLQGYVMLYVSIAFPPSEDAYLNYDSVKFHTRMGYHPCGQFHQCAYKFDRWYDLLCMEKCLCDIPKHPQQPKAFDEICGKLGL